jgi:hypothetical protein
MKHNVSAIGAILCFSFHLASRGKSTGKDSEYVGNLSILNKEMNESQVVTDAGP